MAYEIITVGLQPNAEIQRSHKWETGSHCAKYKIAHRKMMIFMLTIIHHKRTFYQNEGTALSSVTTKEVLPNEQSIIIMLLVVEYASEFMLS